MRSAKLLLTLATVLASVLVCAAADQGKFPSNEDLRHFRAIKTARLSPEGGRVLVEIADSTADGGRSHLWVVDREHNSFRQLTFSAPGKKDEKDRGESSGEWMPDGNSILFLAHRGEHTQLFRLPLQGGEAVAFDLKLVPAVDESKLPDAVPPVRSQREETPK